MLLLSPSPSRSLAQLVVMLFPIAASVSFEHGVVMAQSPVSHEFTDGMMENPDVRVTRGANPATLRQSPSDDNARLVANDEHDEERLECRYSKSETSSIKLQASIDVRGDSRNADSKCSSSTSKHRRMSQRVWRGECRNEREACSQCSL